MDPFVSSHGILPRYAACSADERAGLGVAGTVAVIGALVLVASVLLAVLRSLLTYGNLVLLRQEAHLPGAPLPQTSG